MQRIPSDMENKLLLLYAMDRLGAVTAEQLLQFMADNRQMDYIPLQLGLAELAEAALVRKKPHPLGTLYALTGRGHDTLAMFAARVPHSRRALVDEQAAQWRSRFARQKQMLSSFERDAGGEYAVSLRLMEGEGELLSLRVSVPTHEMAQRFCDAWIDRAPGLYAQIMYALGEEE